MEERKGVLTPEQEKILDELLKFNNKLVEAVDGKAIQLIDNVGLEKAKKEIPEEYLPFVYMIIDGLFDGLAEMAGE